MLDVARCSACGRPYHTPIVPGLIGPQILKFLERRPHGATLEQIAAEVYGTARDQPEFWARSLRTCIWRMNKAIRPYGWQVCSHNRAFGSRYFLRAYPTASNALLTSHKL